MYRYSNLVLSCKDKESHSSYSPVYGRLLIHRAVLAGLLKEEGESQVLPVKDVTDVEVPEYHAYEPAHISVKDLRSENLVLQGRLCTSRGMDGKNDMSASPLLCEWIVATRRRTRRNAAGVCS